MWERGLNFGQSKYSIIDKTTFIPHIRSNYHVSVPKTIIDEFNSPNIEVALVEITNTSTGETSKRIKKLSREGNSKVISMKAERKIKKPMIKVLDMISEKHALSRQIDSENSMKAFIPKRTRTKRGSTPIYVFDLDDRLVIGGYYKKDIEAKRDIVFDEDTLSAIGLYIAEGGKTAASFTNSWPDAINCVLFFIERYFGVERKNIRASICCNNALKNKKSQLESYWSSQTGICNFARSLHFNNNVKCHQGILELYFCSETIKEIVLKLIDHVVSSNLRNDSSIVRGVLSGDGSPILQTKHVLNHQITFDRKGKRLLDAIFSNHRTRTVKTQPRKVICTRWEENRELLELDPYLFNRKNRLKFAKRFLELPKTQKEKDKTVSLFKREKYPKLLNSFLEHYRTLEEFDLIRRGALEEIDDEYNIC